MTPRFSQSEIPLIRVVGLLRYVRYLEAIGAPVSRLLACSRIPEVVLDHPAAAVPMENAFRFGELACRSLGTEHLGLHVGLESALDDLGDYGRVLQGSLTLHEYLRKGISLYNTLTTGQHLWLSEHGKELRLNVATAGEAGVAAYQSQLEVLVVTIVKIRNAAGADWSPREISFAYRMREGLPEIDLFAGSRTLCGTGETYVTIPRRLLAQRFANRAGDISRPNPAPPGEGPLPQLLGDAVRLQVDNLIPARAHQIDVVADTLAMSARSLQRRLAQEQTTFSQILMETRLRLAADFLSNTDKPIGEIAFDLGYRDASNFTRAFRRHTGVSPLAFRNNQASS